jgi:pre-mRNA-splicing factor ISY1
LEEFLSRREFFLVVTVFDVTTFCLVVVFLLACFIVTMARNEEKAMAMFNRWREAKQIELGLIRPKGEKRPGWISQINDLGECERWRNDVIREINQKTTQIQNTSLGEYRLRELNDEINKLLRTKRAWEYRIRQLGGPDYIRASRVYDDQGRAIPVSSYK